MNEPSNFGTNEDRAFNWPTSAWPYWTLKCAQNQLDDPPYRPCKTFSFQLNEFETNNTEKLSRIH